MTNLPSSTGSGDLDNLAVTRSQFRGEIGVLLEYLAQALGDVTGDYTSEVVNPAAVILQGEPTIEVGANPPTDSDTQRIPSTRWVKESGVYSGDTGYGAPVKAQLWVDTSTTQYSLKAYNDNSSDWQLVSGVPSGTRMLFQQETAPVGWTKQALDNMALRVVSGTPTIVSDQQDFTTVFSSASVSGSVAETILTVDQMPSHSHGVTDDGHPHTCDVNDPGHRHTVNAARVSGDTQSGGGDDEAQNETVNTSTKKTGITVTAELGVTGIQIQSNGASTGHTHGFAGAALDLAINYVDVIVAEKD